MIHLLGEYPLFVDLQARKDHLGFFFGENKKFFAGIWSADPHSLDFDEYPMDEVCVVLAGKITLTEPGKSPEVFATGDVFGIKRGTPVNWNQVPGTRKIFVILES